GFDGTTIIPGIHRHPGVGPVATGGVRDSTGRRRSRASVCRIACAHGAATRARRPVRTVQAETTAIAVASCEANACQHRENHCYSMPHRCLHESIGRLISLGTLNAYLNSKGSSASVTLAALMIVGIVLVGRRERRHLQE